MEEPKTLVNELYVGKGEPGVRCFSLYMGEMRVPMIFPVCYEVQKYGDRGLSFGLIMQYHFLAVGP